MQKQFGEIRISQGVLGELRISEELPGSRVVQEAINSGWLKAEESIEQALVQTLKRDLDNGEAESIALALQLRADLILLDERDGKMAAKSVALNVTGVIGVLLKARRAGQLSSLRQAVQDLQEKAGFWISPGLLSQLESLPEFQKDLKSKRRARATRAKYSEVQRGNRKSEEFDIPTLKNLPVARRGGGRKL